MVQPLKRTTGRLLNKLEIKIPYVPVILLLGIYLEKTTVQKYTCIPMLITALFTIARTLKPPRCPLTDVRNEWIKKLYIYTMECYSAIRRNKFAVVVR